MVPSRPTERPVSERLRHGRPQLQPRENIEPSIENTGALEGSSGAVHRPRVPI